MTPLKWSVGSAIYFLYLAVPVSGSDSFLSLPVTDSEVTNLQGWRYTKNFGGGIHLANGAIDYGRRISGTLLSFDIMAAAGKVAVWDDDPNSKYGNVVLIRHNVDGRHYVTLYAHLEPFEVSGRHGLKMA